MTFSQFDHVGLLHPQNTPGVANFPEVLVTEARVASLLQPPSCFRSALQFLLREKFNIMAGEGGVDIDLYATVDEFEPEVAGQVRFREDFVHGEF